MGLDWFELGNDVHLGVSLIKYYLGHRNLFESIGLTIDRKGEKFAPGEQSVLSSFRKGPQISLKRALTPSSRE